MDWILLIVFSMAGGIVGSFIGRGIYRLEMRTKERRRMAKRGLLSTNEVRAWEGLERKERS